MKIREIKKKKFSNFFHQQSTTLSSIFATLSSTLLLETCLGWSVLTRASLRLLIVTISSTLPIENQCLLLGGDVPKAIAKPPYRRPKAFLLWLAWVYLITIILTTCWRGPLRIKRLDLVRMSLNSKGRGSHIWKKWLYISSQQIWHHQVWKAKNKLSVKCEKRAWKKYTDKDKKYQILGRWLHWTDVKNGLRTIDCKWNHEQLIIFKFFLLRYIFVSLFYKYTNVYHLVYKSLPIHTYYRA